MVGVGEFGGNHSPPAKIGAKRVASISPKIQYYKNSLVNKLVALGAEARKCNTVAIAPLGYDLKNINLWS